MFEYAKEELNKKIRELENEIAFRKDEEFSYKKSREHILSYFNIKNEISSFIGSTIFGIVSGTVLIFIAWKLASTFALFCGFACFPMVGFEISKIITKKKLLNNEYSDILSYSNEDLSDQLRNLSQKELDACEKRKNFDTKRNYYCIELEKVKRYKNIIDEVVGEISLDPYYKADTEEEYQMLVLARNEKLKMMDDFFAETKDYTNIHFDNKVGDRIQYTDNSKKLFKKM